MIDHKKRLCNALTDWFAMLWFGLRTALSTAAEPDEESEGTDRGIDPDFEGWVQNDPMVTGNPASRYGDDAPGYLTGNGLGSLEIGAADD
jgi:hypothetical protein